MKRMILAAMAAVSLLALAGCDVLGSTSSSSNTPGAADIFAGTGTGGGTSQWWIKGSFDGWTEEGKGDQDPTGAATHFLSIDSLNPNLLSFEIAPAAPGLRINDYEFVIMNDGAAGSRVKFDFVYDATTTKFADNTAYTLSASSTGSANAKFTASATSYVVKVDITNPAAPRVKLVPGAAAATPYTEQELADGLTLKGDVFDSAWFARTTTSEYVTGTKDGIYDAATHTVTFAGLKARDKNLKFGVNSLSGWMTVPDLTANAASPVTSTLVSGGNNPVFTPVGNSDAVYTFAILIDSSKSVADGRYTLTVTVTNAGSAAWPDPIDPIDTTIVTTVMTNGTGAGNSWGAQLGTISTAVAGGRLYVKVHFATVNQDNNLYLLLDNAGISTGATSLAGDLTTGWGNLGVTSNTAAFNPDLIVWGYRDNDVGAVFHQGGAKVLTGTTGTDVASQVAVQMGDTNADIWFRIPLTTLSLDTTHKVLNAVVLFGKDTGAGGLHSAIPVSIDTAAYADIPDVASTTLGL